MTIEEIQEECKKRFPIGCTYDDWGYVDVLQHDVVTYSIVKGHIYAHEGAGVLYNGNTKTFAKLISLPEGYVDKVKETINEDYSYLIPLLNEIQ